MKNKKLPISIFSTIVIFLVLVFAYYGFSYSVKLNRFKENISKDNYEEAYAELNSAKNNIFLKNSFIKSSNNIILEKLSKIEEDYKNETLSEEKTIENLNNLLTLDCSSYEIINFKNSLPLIKSSESYFDEGISNLENENYEEAISCFKEVSPLSEHKDKATEYEKTCLDKIRGPILEKVDDYISEEKYSKGIEYLNSQKEVLPNDEVLKEKEKELEDLRLSHLENYSKDSVEKETYRTAPLKEYYKKLNEDTINQFDINSNTNHLVFVNISEQKTYIYEGEKNNWNLEKTLICSTGIEGKETPVGEFTVQDRASWFFSPKYGQGGKYYVQFMGNYLFHSIPFDENRDTVLDETLGTPSSHGCIRLSVEDSKWMYDNIKNGTKIIIY